MMCIFTYIYTLYYLEHLNIVSLYPLLYKGFSSVQVAHFISHSVAQNGGMLHINCPWKRNTEKIRPNLRQKRRTSSLTAPPKLA